MVCDEAPEAVETLSSFDHPRSMRSSLTQHIRELGKRIRHALGSTARATLVGAVLILPVHRTRPLGQSIGAEMAHATAQTLEMPVVEDEELEVASEHTKPNEAGKLAAIKIAKLAAVTGVAGAGITYTLSQQKKAKEAREQEAAEYMEAMMKANAQTETLAFPTGSNEIPKPNVATTSAPAMPPSPPPPSVDTESTEKRKIGLNIFSKKAPVTFPTVDELTAPDTPQASVCRYGVKLETCPAQHDHGCLQSICTCASR